MSFYNTEQFKHSEALRSNNRIMNENIRIIEGFGEMSANKNRTQTIDTTASNEIFGKNIVRYDKRLPDFISETRKTVSANKNVKDNNFLFKNGVNTMYDFTFEKEGCYKSAGAAGLELQTDMNDVSAETCNRRTYELGYSGFAIGKNSSGKLDCYLSKDISQAKVGGISTKPITSFAFKKSISANTGGLLGNGQLGIFDNNIENNLVTDLSAVEGCYISGADINVNESSLTATFGGNCRPTLSTITSDFNGKCIEQKNGTKDAWLQMQMSDCQPYNANQNMTYDINSKTIYAPGSNLCFDVTGGGTTDGTKVIQYPCSGGANQKWSYKSDKTLRPDNAPDKCLDIWMADNNNGAGLVIATCHGKSNQTWNIKNNGTMVTPSEPRLKSMQGNEWTLIARDKETGGVPDASFWALNPKSDGKHTYYPMGNTIYAGSAGTVYNNKPPDAGTLIAGDVVDPLMYLPMAGPGGKDDVGIKRPFCPAGYSSMGDVVIDADEYPNPRNIKCIPTDCIAPYENQSNTRTVWKGLGIELKSRFYNLFQGDRGDNTLNYIRDSCLK